MEGSERSAPSLFAGRAVPYDPDRRPDFNVPECPGGRWSPLFHGFRPLEFWAYLAQFFVANLGDWANPDPDDDPRWVFGPEDRILPEPPDPYVWYSRPGERLSLCRVGLADFSSITAELAAYILATPGLVAIDPARRSSGPEPLTDLADLVEAAYLAADEGGRFDFSPIRLALSRAMRRCRTLRTAVNRPSRISSEAIRPDLAGGQLTSPEPRAHFTPSGPEPAPLPTLAEKMRTTRPRSGIKAAFLDFMQDRTRASFEELGRVVHGDKATSDDAIRTNVSRVNLFLEEQTSPIRYRCAAGYVTKHENPE